MSNIVDKIWVNDFSILIHQERLLEFVPTKDMTTVEKINAIVRFSFYLSVLLSVCKNSYLYFYIFIGTLIITYLIYIFNDNIEQFKPIQSEPLPMNKFQNANSNNNNNNNNNNSENAKTSKCVLPTKNNPFMNVMLTDNYKRKAACRSTDNKEIQEQVDKHFNNDLYKDVSAIFNKRNSQRSFYTMPSTTVPNDQIKFANWLYKVPKTCKEGNGNQCIANLHTSLYRH